MVTRHTASLITVNARGWSAAATRDSRCVASVIAVTDHTSALAPAARSPAWSRFQASRHGAEQNRSCSRRGTNEVPHCSHFRVSAAMWSIPLTLTDAGERKVTTWWSRLLIILCSLVVHHQVGGMSTGPVSFATKVVCGPPSDRRPQRRGDAG